MVNITLRCKAPRNLVGEYTFSSFKELYLWVLRKFKDPSFANNLIIPVAEHGEYRSLTHREKRVNYFLDQTKDFLKSLDVRRQEKGAEVFATYFLIPGEKLNRILKEEWVMNSPDPVPDLAEEFQVSENFMKRRLEFEKQ